MAEETTAPQMQKTLGLTGLTSNAMALIAPGAFLWLTFAIQANTGIGGVTAPSMWIGIFAHHWWGSRRRRNAGVRLIASHRLRCERATPRRENGHDSRVILPTS